MADSIGWLITSTFLSLCVIPVVYSFVDGFEEWANGLFGQRQPEGVSAGHPSNPTGIKFEDALVRPMPLAQNQLVLTAPVPKP